MSTDSHSEEPDAIKIRQLELENALDLHPNSVAHWRALAELYFKDGCYINVAWICAQKLAQESDIPATGLLRTCLSHVGLLDVHVWLPCPTGNRLTGHWDQRSFEGQERRWANGPWSVARAECIGMLLDAPQDCGLWHIFSVFYFEWEEYLLSLWCYLRIAVNVCRPLDRDRLSENWTFLTRDLSPCLWSEELARLAQVQSDMVISALMRNRPRDRVLALADILNEAMGFDLSTDPNDARSFLDYPGRTIIHKEQ